MSFLKGKTAIITGAGKAVLTDGNCGSIGYGIATAYAKEGANLVLTGRNLKKFFKDIFYFITLIFIHLNNISNDFRFI